MHSTSLISTNLLSPSSWLGGNNNIQLTYIENLSARLISLKICAFLILLFMILVYGVCFYFYFTDKEISPLGKYTTLVNYHANRQEINSGFH
jgi:hypothetical protein